MKKILFITAILLSLTFHLTPCCAQSYVGTMKVGDKTFKDVTVKLTVDDSLARASVMIYHVLNDVVRPYRIDLLISDILVTTTSQRTSLVCHNIVPTCEGKEYKEYLVEKLTGTATSGGFSFSCKMGEEVLSYSGVINQRAPYGRVSH